FLGLGPAISRRPISVQIGSVRTGPKSLVQKLAPPPAASPDDLHALLHAGLHLDETPVRAPEPVVAHPAIDELIERIAPEAPLPVADQTAPPGKSAAEVDAAIDAILREMAAEEGCTYQPIAKLYQDFTVRCRMQRLTAGQVDMAGFQRRFAIAVAGMTEPDSPTAQAILQVARVLPDDLLAPFLAIALAAQHGRPCPDDDELAVVYGTSSPGRIRRLLDHYEKTGLIVVRTDFSGRRSVSIPDLGLATEPLEA
ncbi:MAG: hypothetical protein O9272_05975, partial [Brevundimonas sp.]|nr:hypothetical protein [Brevundimonas sp.]